MERDLQRIFRLLAPLVAMSALAACGASDTGGEPVESEADVNTILEQTFSGKDKKVDSGKFDLAMTINASGGDTELSGPVELKVSGPFQSQGAKKIPKFDIDAEFTGSGQNIKGGVTSTGDKAFVAFNGQDYAVSDQVFGQFKQSYEQAAQRSGSATSLSQLGLQPKDWLKDAKIEGDSSVGGTDTVKITAGVDIPKMLADVNVLLSKAGSLGLSNTGQLPSKLTDEQIRQVEEAVKAASVELETGKEDSILRRIAFTLSVEDPDGSGGKADIDFDLSLTELNEDQEISEPTDTKPFEELLGQLGGLGGLGALGSGTPPPPATGSGGASGTTSGGAPSSAANSEAAQKYARCIQEAGSDTAKARKCAQLIAP